MDKTTTRTEAPVRERKAEQPQDAGLLVMLLLLIVGTLIFAIVGQQ